MKCFSNVFLKMQQTHQCKRLNFVFLDQFCLSGILISEFYDRNRGINEVLFRNQRLKANDNEHTLDTAIQ